MTSVTNASTYPFKSSSSPLLRNLPNPLNPGILHLPCAAHALGDSLGDDRLFELLVFLNGGLGALDDSVNLGTLAVKKSGNAVLLSERWMMDVAILRKITMSTANTYRG